MDPEIPYPIPFPADAARKVAPLILDPRRFADDPGGYWRARFLPRGWGGDSWSPAPKGTIGGNVAAAAPGPPSGTAPFRARLSAVPRTKAAELLNHLADLHGGPKSRAQQEAGVSDREDDDEQQPAAPP